MRFYFLIVAFLTIIKSFSQDKRPNIVFIITDDHKADALSYLGHQYVKTPNLDKLAKKGAIYKNAFSTTPICSASRASILTGTYERNHRYTFQTGNLDANLLSNAYPKLLREDGYTTAMFGKLGVNIKSHEILFDEYDNYDRNTSFNDRRGYFYKTIEGDTVHLSRFTSYKAIDFLSKVDKSKPFMLNLCFSAPHAHDSAPDQYFTSKEHENLLSDVNIPDPILSEDRYFMAQPENVRNGFSRLRWTWRFDNPAKYQKMVKAYYNMISELDVEVGKVMATLKKQGLDKNTIIIILGDNGYLLGERQLADKWLMYDASIKVPLIIYDPRKEKHIEVEDMVLNIDIPSTILDYANVKIPSQYQGLSLKDINQNKKSKINRDTILIEHLWNFDEIPPSEGIRTNQWKYFRYVNNKNWEELYDLHSDPIEAINLANDDKYTVILKNLRTACDQQTKQKVGDIALPPFGLNTEFIREPKHTVIYDLNPEFGWKIPAAAKYQIAYQIILASSLEKINANIGDVWDSGTIKSTSSQNIEYPHKALEIEKKYYWKVRYWDQENRLSDYSEVQEFVTGRSDKYITSPNHFQIHNQHAIKSWTSNNLAVYDFEKHGFGTLYFKYDSPANDTLLVELGEKLDSSKNSIDSNPGGTIRYSLNKVPVKKGLHDYMVKLLPDTRNTLPIAVPMPDTFPVITPFRYAQFSNLKNPIQNKDIYQSRYSVFWDENQSSFNSNDTILNQIWALCKYTIKATSFAGIYVDGDRERIPYEADAYLNQLGHYTTDPEFAIGRQTIEWFMKNPTWPTEWQQHVALMMHADYMYTGNTEMIKAFYENVKHKSLMDLLGEHGLITSTKVTDKIMKKLGFSNPEVKLKDITDWPPAKKDTQWKIALDEGERDGFIFRPYNTLINNLYYRNLIIMAEFADILGKTNDKLRFLEAAAIAKKSINELMFDENTGAYVDGIGTDHSSLHSNMFAVAMGVVPDERVKSVVDFIKSRGMACSVYGAQYLMEALYKGGEDEYALQLLTATHDRSWYNMIKAGSTVTLEAWDIMHKPNLDWNHAWGAVPANIIPRAMWGITPAVPGCSVMNMNPQLGSLEYCTLETPTLRGIIKAEYKKINSRRHTYKVEVPGNMVIHFKKSSVTNAQVLLNGQKVSTMESYFILEPGDNTIEYITNTF